MVLLFCGGPYGQCTTCMLLPEKQRFFQRAGGNHGNGHTLQEPRPSGEQRPASENRDSSENERQPGAGLAPSGSAASVQSLQSPHASAADIERDPRRNGLDNPFGEGGRLERLHPDLLLLTGALALRTSVHCDCETYLSKCFARLVCCSITAADMQVQACCFLADPLWHACMRQIGRCCLRWLTRAL